MTLLARTVSKSPEVYDVNATQSTKSHDFPSNKMAPKAVEEGLCL